MWKFIVIWCVLIVTHNSPEPKSDEFGRTGEEGGITIKNAMLYTQQVNNCDHSKDFYIRDSAFAFYNNGVDIEKRQYPDQAGNLSNIKINSIFLNK